MQLIAPDILAEARGLSIAVSATGLVIGILLWLSGWSAHRFWIVLFTTLVAGFAGLHSGRVFGVQPLVVALLAAIAAGMLALALVRVVAFVAGGACAWLAIHQFAPAWNEPLVCFLAGGLAGLLLFRLWTMTLTSFAGTLVLSYSGLALADRLGKLDAVAWTDARTEVLNWSCAGLVLVGLMGQYVLHNWWTNLDRRRKQKAMKYLSEEERDQIKKLHHRKPWYAGLGRMAKGKRAA